MFNLPHTIRGKIIALFTISFMSVSLLTLVSLLSLSVVRNRFNLIENYDDMLNSMLEVRRFEKNLIYFHDQDSLKEQVLYLDKIEAQVAELADDIVKVGGKAALGDFSDNLLKYKALVMAFGNLDSDKHFIQDKPSPEAEKIRVLGKDLLSYVEGLFKAKSKHIHTAILRTSILPFAFLALFVLLMVLVGQLLFRRVLQPLKIVAESTKRVARGEFVPVPCDGMEEDEIRGLLSALNNMAHELDIHQEEMLQSRKMAALGAFTAGVAHELNNPLNNISLTAQAVIEEYANSLDQEGRELLDDILTQADRAAEIVSDLLNFSRTSGGGESRLRINQLIKNAISLLRNQLLISKVGLTLDLASDLPDIRGNARNVEQTLMNLVLNAIQAMPEGGRIALKTYLAEEENSWVRVEVSDSGPGIDPEDLSHIFDPFYTTKSVGKGTGLGLAVVYSMVKRQGGRIKARNQDEGGAVFIISLPPFPPEQEPVQ